MESSEKYFGNVESILMKKSRIIYLFVFLAIFGAGFAFLKSYHFAFEASASIDKIEQIGCKQPVEINFSNPMIVSSVLENINIEPKVDVEYSWKDSNKTLVIQPKKIWNPDTNYKITINSAKNIMLLTLSKEFSFQSAPLPKVIEFTPKKGEKDVELDIENPIVVKFDRSLDNFKVRFVVDPFKNIATEINDDKTEIKLMPKEDLEEGKKYSIIVFIKYINDPDEKYQKISETNFMTKSAVQVPQNWASDFPTRLSQAKEFTQPQILEGKYIDVNLKSQVMVIFEDGKVLDAYMVSSGKRGMETPQGSYQIANKTPRAWSKEFGLFMPYWMALVSSGKFGIHELPEWPGGYKEGVNHLGTPVSHGCVRLGVGPAERVYDWAEIGTPVVVHD